MADNDTPSTVVDLKKNKGQGGGGDGGNQVPDIIGSAKKAMREAAKNKAEAKAKELYGKKLEVEKSGRLLDEELATVQAELNDIYAKHS